MRFAVLAHPHSEIPRREREREIIEAKVHHAANRACTYILVSSEGHIQ